jgi:acyl carrier protein
MTLKEEIEKKLNLKIDSIDDNTTLIQLGVDSIKLVEMAGIIEENTDIVLHEDDIFEINGKWLKNLVKNEKN